MSANVSPSSHRRDPFGPAESLRIPAIVLANREKRHGSGENHCGCLTIGEPNHDNRSDRYFGKSLERHDIRDRAFSSESGKKLGVTLRG